MGLSMERRLTVFIYISFPVSHLPCTASMITSADLRKRPTARAKVQ